MQTHEFVEKIMLSPHVSLGRDYDGTDCYGVVYCGYRDVLGIKLGLFDLDGWPEVERTIAQQAATWLPIEMGEQKPFDVAVMLGMYKRGGRMAAGLIHVGLFVDCKTILHSEDSAGKVCVPLSRVAHRVRAIYRHRSVA